MPARLEQILEFQFDHPYILQGANGGHIKPPRIAIVGLYTRNDCSVRFEKKTTSFAVFFQPDGFSRLFHIPQSELSNNAFDTRELLGGSLDQLYEQLQALRSFEERAAVAERYLLSRAARATDTNVIGKIAAHIFANRGVVCLADFADAAAISSRQLQRRFQSTTGIGAKTYARLARFQSALDLKLFNPRQSWLSVAHDLGYHDQMHMIHDFHEFAGASPNDILSQLGDARPESLITSSSRIAHNQVFIFS